MKVAMWMKQHGKGEDKKPLFLSLETLPSFSLSFHSVLILSAQCKRQWISSAVAGAVVPVFTSHRQQEGNAI